MLNAKFQLLSIWGLWLSRLVELTDFHRSPAVPIGQVLFTGRFDFSNLTKVVFSHVGNSIKANFSGTGVSVSLASASVGASAASYLYILIDDIVTPENRPLITVTGLRKKSYVLASDLPAGNHTVELVKESEYDTKVAFHGFTVTDGTLLAPPTRPALKLEFYGDSNPAGWNAYDPADGSAAINNGGYYIYPAITCRMLNAECSNLSMGGVGITDKAWRNLANYFHLINMNDPASRTNLWNFSNYMPNAVIINASSNDHSSDATKAEIKAGWKNFVNLIRGRYPNAHIVIAESYGWSYNEPTDYIEETVNEIKAAGNTNVSYVKFPWLWGQNHAIINEHAGFANILAPHIATMLNLPPPTPNTLSSFAPYGSVTNGSFEKATIPGVADGWRPNGTVTLVQNADDAKVGTSYLKLYNSAWVNFAGDAKPGDTFTVTGWMRGAQNGDLGKLKLEFKDQAQNIVGANEGLITLTANWQQFTTTAVAPPGTWSVWVVLVAEKVDCVSFDNVSLTWR